MDLEWQEIGWDSGTIERIAHDGVNLFVEFKKNYSGYKYHSVPYEIFIRILNKECNDKKGKPSYGATLDALVKKGGYTYEQYK
jgi:hypothetical protein